MAAANAAQHTSLAAKFCTPDIWEQYKDTKQGGLDDSAGDINSVQLQSMPATGSPSAAGVEGFREPLQPSILIISGSVPRAVRGLVGPLSRTRSPVKFEHSCSMTGERS